MTSSRRFPVRWAVLAIFLALIAIAAFGNVSTFYVVLYAFAGLVAITWIWQRATARGLEITRRFDDHAFFGQRVVVRLEVRNRSLWPIVWLKVHDRLPIELSSPPIFRAVASLGPRQRARLEYGLLCQRRGYYTLGPLSANTGDFWGLFEEGGFTVAPQRLIVYPKVLPLTELNLTSMAPHGDLLSPQRLIEDPSRFFGLRPYVAGDSLRKVDWKTTAARGSLEVKRYQSSLALDSHLFLNANLDDYSGRGPYSATELGITIVASLAAHLGERRQALGLTVLGLDPLAGAVGAHTIGMRKGRAHLMQILELLARVQTAPTRVTFASTLQQASTSLPWGSMLLLVTPWADDALFSILPGLQRHGLQPVLILIRPEDSYAASRAQAAQLGVPCFWIEREKDLGIWQEARRR